jgi:hypothetical protein
VHYVGHYTISFQNARSLQQKIWNCTREHFSVDRSRRQTDHQRHVATRYGSIPPYTFMACIRTNLLDLEGNNLKTVIKLSAKSGPPQRSYKHNIIRAPKTICLSAHERGTYNRLNFSRHHSANHAVAC